MLHRQSNDPVLVKKISLRIWTLRDEVEFRIKERLSQKEAATSTESSEELKDLIVEYTPRPLANAGGPIPAAPEAGKPALNLIKGGQEENAEKGEASDDGFGEDEMRKAMEEAAKGKEGAAPTEAKADAPTAPTGEEAKIENTAAVVDAVTGPSAGTTTEQAPPSSEDANAPVLIRQKRPPLQATQFYHGRTLLAEVYMDKMMFFSEQRFCEGQSIVIEFLIPKRFIVNADVSYCRHYSMKNRIISEHKLPYRINVQFTFLRPGERTLLREFLESIEPDLSKIKKDIKPKKAEGEGDELDDLANLGV